MNVSTKPMRAKTLRAAAIQIATDRSRICLKESVRYSSGDRTSSLSLETREQMAATERAAAFAARDLVDMFESVAGRLGADMQLALVAVCNKRFAELQKLVDVHEEAERKEFAACVRCASGEVRYIGELIEQLTPAKT